MKASVDVATLRTQLANAAVFASKEATRPTLSAVRIEFGAPTIDSIQCVATNSYELVRARCEAKAYDDAGEFLLDLGDVKTLLANLKPALAARNSPVADLVVEGDTLCVSFIGSSFTFQRVIGEFPNYQQLLDGYESGEIGAFAFTTASMKRLASIVREGRKPEATGLALQFNLTELKPATFTVGDDIDGLVMPARVH